MHPRRWSSLPASDRGESKTTALVISGVDKVIVVVLVIGSSNFSSSSSSFKHEMDIDEMVDNLQVSEGAATSKVRASSSGRNRPRMEESSHSINDSSGERLIHHG